MAHPQEPHHPSEKPVIHCHKCGEPCKGEVLRVQARHFHIKCFTCKGKTLIFISEKWVSLCKGTLNRCDPAIRQWRDLLVQYSEGFVGGERERMGVEMAELRMYKQQNVQHHAEQIQYTSTYNLIERLYDTFDFIGRGGEWICHHQKTQNSTFCSEYLCVRFFSAVRYVQATK